VVIGHSIGAASAVVASATDSSWARSMILIDPALSLTNTQREFVLDNQRKGHLSQGVAEITAAFPHWHPLDVQLKVQAHTSASLFALEQSVFDNDPWDVTREAQNVVVPTHVLGAEADNGSMFSGDYAADMLAQNAHFSYEVIPGSGHSVHRDKPAETIAAIRAFLA
jgi:pimeloyl-ACP methyl ester carboxylesterase